MFKRLFKRHQQEAHSSAEPEPVDCIEGSVETVGEHLVLRIPLDAGGDRLVDCAKGIGHIEGDSLEIPIQPWLADKLGLIAGSRVVVGRKGRKFVLWRSDQQPGLQ